MSLFEREVITIGEENLFMIRLKYFSKENLKDYKELFSKVRYIHSNRYSQTIQK